MNVKVGSAPDNWGVWFPDDPRQTPWQRFMDEMVEAGYEYTELGPYGYLPTETNVLKAELAKRGLKVSGTFAMGHLEDPASWADLQRQVLGAGDSLAALGAPFLILIDDTYNDLATGVPRVSSQLDDTAWQRLIDRTHEVADIIASRFELKLVFHPHAETHVEREDQIERFLEDTDPNRISLCLDTGHHAYCEGDPVRFFRQHHKRISYLHLKSIDREVQKKIEREKIPFAGAVGLDMFCEPSTGAVDFLGLRDAMREVNYDGYAIVEQDMYPAPFDKPLPIAKRTREYLREIGIG